MRLPHAHIPYGRLAEHIRFIREKRLNLEIYFPSADLDTLTGDAIRDLEEKLDYGPELSIHAPFMDLSPGAMDSKVRQATTERFDHVLDIACALKPRAVVFHSGYEKWKYGLNQHLWLKQSLLTWRPLNERAAAAGIKIAIENIFEEEPSNLRLLMQEMDSANFGVCFDTGHFHLFSGKPLEEWMIALNPYIVELHLHDNDRTSDQHRPMGAGSFDFAGFFGLLEKEDCVMTIEAHTAEDFLTSLEYLERLKVPRPVPDRKAQ